MNASLKVEDLIKPEQELREGPQPPWTLIGPDGRVWRDPDPRKLLYVLVQADAAIVREVCSNCRGLGTVTTDYYVTVKCGVCGGKGCV